MKPGLCLWPLGPAGKQGGQLCPPPVPCSPGSGPGPAHTRLPAGSSCTVPVAKGYSSPILDIIPWVNKHLIGSNPFLTYRCI